LILNTTKPESTLGRLADYKFVIKVDNKDLAVEQRGFSAQPMGSAFEQLSLLLYDAMILAWVRNFHLNYDLMRERHANLE
jgi:6-phospho-3-hexuloisomerase